MEDDYDPDDEDEVFTAECSNQDITRCLLHCRNPREKLTQLKTKSTWEIILKAARIRDCQPLLELSARENVPSLHYHRKCYQTFTMKSQLGRIEKKKREKDVGLQGRLEKATIYESVENTTARRKSSSTSSTTSSVLLPKMCLFCNKETKYNKRLYEKLRKCCERRVEDTIRKAAMDKQDFDMISLLSTTDIVAAEAMYHHSCQVVYTRVLYVKKNPGNDDQHKEYKAVELDAYHQVIKYCHEIIHEPEIVKLQYLISIMESHFQKHSIELSKSTRKHLRRNLEKTFESELNFVVVKGTSYVYPFTLSIEKTVIDLIECKSGDVSDDIVIKAAECIRKEVKGMKDEMPWPPQPDDLQPETFQIPDMLKLFLTTILTGQPDKNNVSGRTARIRLSLAQDIVYNVSNGKIKTPKSILLPSVIKSLTNNTELINITNRLGHSVSYSILAELFTEHAFNVQEQQANEDLILPLESRNEEFTIYVADNIDRREETLSGYGTTHKVNNLILQGQFGNTYQPRTTATINPPKTKRCRRSFEARENEASKYHHRKRIGPSGMNFPTNEASDLIKDESNKRHFLWALMRFHDMDRSVPSWTGFQILIRNQIPVLKTTVGYLDCINASAVEISTIYQVMDRAVKILESLRLVSIVCVFDQAIYSKAVEIKWKESDKFKDCVVMMGLFHMLMMFMHILSKRFSDAGLRDVLIQSNVIAEGSVDKALSGKMYNRGVRMYKLMYEAIMAKVLELMSSDSTDNEDIQKLVMMEVKEINCDEVLTNNTFATIYNKFIDTKLNLAAPKEEYGLPQFWISFLDMVELLLNTIASIRSGNWELLLECIRDILPYTFAYDNLNYARYLTGMLGEMLELPTKFPEVYREFMQGNFAAQLSNNQFSRIETDKVIETTLNKDTKTSGGCTGFSTNVNAVKRWEISATYRAALRTCFHKFLNYQPPKYRHPDLNPARISKDENDVQNILATLAETFIDPFSPQQLLSISTGVLATDKVAHDMREARRLGECALKDFIGSRLTTQASKNFFDPIKKMKLGTFTTMNKVNKCSVNSKIIPLQASKDLFSKISLVARIRSIDIKYVFKYPLGVLPWSLAEPIGTLKKTSKASLLHKLEGTVDPLESLHGNFALIIDGMAFVQQSKVANITFGDLAMNLLHRVLVTGSSAKRIDVVFDVYYNRSIKNIERQRRSRGQINFKKIVGTAEIKQFGAFLSSNDNKNALTKFFVNQWKSESYRSKIGQKKFLVTDGEKVFRIGESAVSEETALSSNQEEADTRMILHAKHAASDFDKVMIASPDTDVFILLLSFHAEINARLYFLTGVKSSRRIIDVKRVTDEIHSSLSQQYVSKELLMNSLLGFHCFTGCDTISAFAGRGKLKPMNAMVKDQKYLETFSELGSQHFASAQHLESLGSFTCRMYGGKINDINDMRYQMYCKSGGKIGCEYLPPCRNVLQLHCERANYQVRVWRQSLLPYQEHLEPQQHGWINDNNGDLEVNWMTCSPAPDEILELMSCDCKKQCSGNCPCISNSLPCTDICCCGGCMELVEDVSDEEEFDSSSDDD